MAGGVKAITANRLRDGAVVYLGTAGRWVESLAEAAAFEGQAETEAGLAAAAADVRANVVLEVVAVDAARSDSGLKPVHIREAIRAAGPTVHREHGKQATPGVSGAPSHR